MAITNLESAPEIGLFKALAEGFCKMFLNFGKYLRFYVPPCIVAISVFLMFTPVIFIKNINLCCNLVVMFIGIGLFLYWFWQSVLGFVAISYFAKDIFENKPVQSTETYFSYVKPYSLSYAGIFLWYVIIWFFLAGCIFLPYIGFKFFIPSIGITFGILSIILYIFASIANTIVPIVWAYNDKTRPMDSVVKSIKLAFNKFFPLFVFSFIVCLLSSAISLLLSLPFFHLHIDFVASACLQFALCIFASFIAPYIFCFVYTRYHFTLLK